MAGLDLLKATCGRAHHSDPARQYDSEPEQAPASNSSQAELEGLRPVAFFFCSIGGSGGSLFRKFLNSDTTSCILAWIGQPHSGRGSSTGSIPPYLARTIYRRCTSGNANIVVLCAEHRSRGGAPSLHVVCFVAPGWVRRGLWRRKCS